MIPLLLQAAAGSAEGYLVQQGFLGVAVLALLSGFLFLARRLVKERDDLAAQREEMISTLLQVVPLVQRTTAVLEDRKVLDERNLALKEQMASMLDEMKRMLDDVRRSWSHRSRGES